MDIFHQSSVARSRKTRVCSWCGEAIEIGSPYERYEWRADFDHGTETMHPECNSAMKLTVMIDGEIFFSHGDFSRGCGCPHGDCRCVSREGVEG